MYTHGRNSAIAVFAAVAVIGNGDDVLNGANGLVDTIRCGAGTDIVVYDLVVIDNFRFVSSGGDCESAVKN